MEVVLDTFLTQNMQCRHGDQQNWLLDQQDLEIQPVNYGGKTQVAVMKHLDVFNQLFTPLV